MTLFAGISPEISLLQAGFLAFTVYLSAVILRTLLRGKSLLKLYHWRRHSTGEDCIDGDHVDFVFNVLTISISIPSTLPPVSSMKETKEEMDLFNAEDLYGLVKCMQKSTQNFEKDPAQLHSYGWRVVVKAISTEFHAGNDDDTGIKPIVELTGLSYKPPSVIDPAQNNYFTNLVTWLRRDLKSYWKGRVNVTFAGDSKQVVSLSSSPSVSRTNSLFTFWQHQSLTMEH